MQYSAKFLPNFAQEAEPLRSLLRKNEPFIWGEAQERSFQKLKQLVAQATTLAYFRGDCNTRIIADAGPQGLGAVLTQLQDGEWRAISYASRNLNEVERRYSQTEKEALALVWACERFNIYVYGRKFELETDHNVWSRWGKGVRGKGICRLSSAWFLPGNMDMAWLPYYGIGMAVQSGIQNSERQWSLSKKPSKEKEN